MTENTTRRENCGRKRPKGYISNYRPQAKTRKLLAQVQEILDEYRSHLPLTCRQIYYRLVAAHGYPKTESAYKRLCDHLVKARRARRIPFESVRDDGLSTYRFKHFDDVDGFWRSVKQQGEMFTLNKLAAQNLHIEIWAEAGGMLAQLDRVARPFSVKVYSSGGFDGVTPKKDLADRLGAYDVPTHVLHLGDHDPSGESLAESLVADILAFVAEDFPGRENEIHFHRLALTHEQILEYDLPTQPPKATDSRTKNWDGDAACQLEALQPDTIAKLVQDAILALIDTQQFLADLETEQKNRREITHLLPAPSQ